MTERKSKYSNTGRSGGQPRVRSKYSYQDANSQISGSNRNRRNGAANPKASLDRYLALAREAVTSGDLIEAENYAQHAEHFYRVMNMPA